MTPESDPAFLHALDFTLRFEGGYSNVPGDNGGPTEQGVTQRTYDGYRQRHGLPTQDVRKMTGAELRSIYYVGYWTALRCGEMPAPVAIALFDYAVNSGPDRAAKGLQGALGVAVDGQIGPKTLDTARGVDRHILAEKLISRRQAFLRGIATGHNAQFLKGWMRRCEDLRKIVKSA